MSSIYFTGCDVNTSHDEKPKMGSPEF